MKVNDRYCSFYYENDDDYGTIEIEPEKTALLIIDAEYACVKRPQPENPSPAELENIARWEPFYEKYDKVIIPNLQRLISLCRRTGIEVTYAKIQGFKSNSRDRSLDQRFPVSISSWLLPVIIAEISFRKLLLKKRIS